MPKIKIKSKKEIELLRDVGKLAAETLQLAGEMVKPGVTTNEIDKFVHDYTVKHGAYPAPLNYRGFPKSVCTSVNECVTHGIPSDYILKDGDIINIDVTSQLNGYHGDTSKTFLVGDVDEDTNELVDVAEKCLYAGIEAAGQSGAYFHDIGTAIEGLADEYGFSVVREYCGHGIGRGFHEEPYVLHYRSNERSPRIKEGMVFTIEPMINAGHWKTKTLSDGWTSVTADGSLSAQFEHTLVVTRDGIEILTKV